MGCGASTPVPPAADNPPDKPGAGFDAVEPAPTAAATSSTAAPSRRSSDLSDGSENGARSYGTPLLDRNRTLVTDKQHHPSRVGSQTASRNGSVSYDPQVHGTRERRTSYEQRIQNETSRQLSEATDSATPEVIATARPSTPTPLKDTSPESQRPRGRRPSSETLERVNSQGRTVNRAGRASSLEESEMSEGVRQAIRAGAQLEAEITRTRPERRQSERMMSVTEDDLERAPAPAMAADAAAAAAGAAPAPPA